MTSLRRLKNISGKYFWFFKNKSCDFSNVITISDKIDVGPLQTLKKWKVFWEQCIAINLVGHEYQWANICVRVLASQRSSKSNNRCIIYYFHWFLSTDKTIPVVTMDCAEIQKSWQSYMKSCVIRFAIDIWSTFLITMLFSHNNAFFLITMFFFSL